MHRRGRREPHGLADLPDRRRIAVPVDVLDEEVPDFLLSSRQHFRLQGRLDEHVFATSVGTPPDVVNRRLWAAPPTDKCAGEDLNLHAPQGAQGPQPCASTNSATSA